MPDLIKCIECEGVISSMASICPHCQTKSPHGFICGLCGKAGKNSMKKEYSETEWKFDGEKEEPYIIVYSYHLECYKKVRQVNYSCPACHQTVRQVQSSCPHCGHPFTTGRCGYCKLELFPPFSVAHGGKLFHEFCASLKKTAWEYERIELQRRAEEKQRVKQDIERQTKEVEARVLQDKQRRLREEAEAERREQAARIKKSIIGFIAILLLIFFIPLLAPLWTSIVNSEIFKTIAVLIRFSSSYFVMGLVPVGGELLFALSSLAAFLFGSLKIVQWFFSVNSSVFFPFLEMFLIALGSGLACLIRWSICISLDR